MLLTCCRGGAGGGGAEEPVRLQAMVVFPPKDTIWFALPATTHHCNDGRSLLLEAASPLGSGMLVRLRYGDTLVAGQYAVMIPNDTAAPRGAAVAVRYLIRDVPHGFSFDSGAVDVRRDGRTLRAHVEGRGLENAIRIFATADYRGLPLTGDTVPCLYRP